MKNAVIGFAFNYSNEQIAPFLHSLNATGFSGDLILYINNKSTIKYNDSFSFRFKLINFEREHRQRILKHKILKFFLSRYYNSFHKSRSFKFVEIVDRDEAFSNDMLAYFYVNYYLATMRFILYYNFFKTNKYENIFFTDVSDVVFQDDIFKNVTPSKILAFEEKKEVCLGQDEWNKDWVIESCGEEAFEAITTKNIYCSGTILGDYDTCITFLEDYIRLMVSRRFKRKIVGLDQGFYNYMVNYQQPAYFKKSKNGKIIFTVALNSPEDFLLKGNQIYFKDMPENLPSVVHQYTRHPEILAFVKKLYS
jgi:hypothetical protein